MTEEIPQDLKPTPGPDLEGFRQILFGILLAVTSPLLWEVGVAMDPGIVGVWRQWIPVAPFGQFFPSVLPQFLISTLYPPLVSGGGGSIGALTAFVAPVAFGIGILFIIFGAVWIAVEFLR
ncbi:hypothetical protein [Halococcus thailandensis]|jgi:hypothetical protein|uniref:Uncharacterized protein n=1 Tax=Halococcus thailandensis JCM 13552 TaxID=1227457 RepID=M0MWS1_9EURY|nr:hypothetical protein [Halococcus thailandensis]EMA48885.1 hypothetical protein C451_19783 [Halococcus thailandensis JCM 13552]